MATFLSDKRIVAILVQEGRPLSFQELLSKTKLPSSECAVLRSRLDSLVAAGSLLCEPDSGGSPCFVVAPLHGSARNASPANNEAKRMRLVTILAVIGAVSGLASLLWQIISSLA